jgi:alpha-tubulin suppressor-like RCC1 family protein
MPLGIALGGIRQSKNNDSILYSTEIYPNLTQATHSIRRDGKLYGFGLNTQYQIGDGSATNRNSPVKIGNLNWLKITGNLWMSIGISSNGNIYRWGANGATAITSPYLFSTGDYSDTSLIMPGNSTYTCFFILRSNGELWGYGSNPSGVVMGTSTSSTTGEPTRVASPSLWSYMASASHIPTVGYNTLLGIKSDGTLWGWGVNSHGQIGNGTTATSTSFLQVGVATWTKVSIGYGHSIGIKTDGSIWGWGLNTYGQVGDGSVTNRTSPVQVNAGSWIDISAGTHHKLAVKSDGTLWGWGYNTYGQVGDGTTTNRTSPVQVAITDVVRCYAGHQNSLALKSDGTLWGWGSRCGNGLANNQTTPIKLN